MSDLLLELLSEEIPARMQAKARADLARLLTEQLAQSGLQAESIRTYSTPRRLALIARGLPLGTPAVSEELKGPRTSAPPQALEGFLRKTGLTPDQLTDRDGTWFALIERPGRATTEVLAEAIPVIVRAFPWPKSMRWGAASISTESPRWVRPLQGVVAMLDEELIDFEIGDVRSSAATVGHRFHHPGRITLAGASDYVEKLRACHVIVDQDERAQLIREGAAAAAAAEGLTLVEDEGLVQENAGLTEWPMPLLGRFDPGFLEVPREVIQLTMRTNQKYFAATNPPRDGEGDHAEHGGGGSGQGDKPPPSALRAATSPSRGGLAPAFICVANIAASDGGAKIVAGNQKVLAARLSDARFFWEQDLKIPLEEQAAKLGQIVFHEKLGTVADKVDRVAKLARWLVEEGIVGQDPNLSARPERSRGAPAPASEPRPSTTLGTSELADLAERAARLCKADLVTQMVGEFPELQGLIGGYLAAAQGEDPQVAAAIRDHYKPVGQGDEVPTDPITVAVSLADKLDSVFSFFGIEKEPSGSKDPFALRRAAIGISRAMQGADLRLSLERTLDAYHRIALSEQLPAFTHFSLSVGKMEEWVPEDDRVPPVEELTYHILSEADVQETLEPPVWHAVLPFREFEERGSLVENELNASAIFVTKEIGFILEGILDFFADRLKVQQREAGVRHDLIDAVFALGGEDDLVRLLARVRALQAFVETPEGTDLLAGYKRAANILKKEQWVPQEGQGQKQLPYTPEPAEHVLIAALDSAEPEAGAAVEREDFEGAMKALATLRAPVDAFFNEVMVNDPDPAKREARLNLLARLRDAVHRVADFSRIEG